ncbi:serine/threonine protein kinase [Streptomyces sp. 2231.1]|uniref:serine/threonine-protein kinase n=1 Tax=Streptomyces sp. 2231.1 TaxID=1855347 RepID=UPI00089930E4|nr:serine/threonine-protein kinase [Streptomyces sp. 2231.1]SED23127.1 serine/threonine protein kinase [Streptomyces sp. 2231.1]
MAPQRSSGTGAEAELPEYAGHYRLESCLGSGGMGVVHLARSTSGMRLAVKVVHAEFARDPEFRGRFRQEVAAARRVSGAFTAPVVDADPEAERPWMATSFIPGPTLSDQVKRHGPMAPEQLRRLMAGLAEALRDIHRVGVVHRDLKPSNVLLADDGPKVIDFGISRPKDSELRTETGKLIGTPPFMAPEQFRRPREVGPAADIFALGSVMVHAATGRGPFDSDSPYVVAYQVIHDEPDLTGVPESLAPLVVRCLAKEPDERPTPDELMRELRSVAASYDTQAFIPAQRTGDDAGQRAGDTAGPLAGARAGRRDGADGEQRLPAAGAGVPEGGGRPSRRSLPGRWARRVLPGRPVVRRSLVAAVAVVLVVGGVCTALLWPRGADGPEVKETGARAGVPAVRAWRTQPADRGSGIPRCTEGARRLLCFRSGSAYALDAADGTRLWRRAVGGPDANGAPALAGGVLVLPTEGGRRLVGLDPASGRTRWQRDQAAGTETRIAGDMLLVTGTDGAVTGVDGASGRESWHRRLPGRGTPALTADAGGTLVHAATTSLDGAYTQVTELDAGTGDTRWTARLRGVLRPVGSDGGALILLSDDSAAAVTDAVVRYSPASGTTRRTRLTVPLTAPQAAVHGRVLHLLAAGGSLEAVDLRTGKRRWHLETAVSRGSAPVATADHVYVSAPDGRLLAVAARDGRLLGQTPPRLGAGSGQVAGTLPAPLAAGAQVYATAPDGSVFAVDGRTPAAW